MRIVFMGTPDFAVPCLQRILDDGHEVPAVFTQPDKPVGRHAVLTPPPVKQLAQERGIPVYQPTKMRDGTVAAQLRELAPDKWKISLRTVEIYADANHICNHLGGGGHAAAAGATVNGSETDVRRRVLDAIERELEG